MYLCVDGLVIEGHEGHKPDHQTASTEGMHKNQNSQLCKDSVDNLGRVYMRHKSARGTEAGMLRFNCVDSVLFNCPEYSVMTPVHVPNRLNGQTLAEKHRFQS